MSALQHRRRKSVAPGSAQKRYGEWFAGDDRELEHTLHVGACLAVEETKAAGGEAWR
jgi:hypothetical protein